MLYELLITLYVFICFLLILLVLVQKGKGSTGLGGLGGGTQMLFGGSGGQDVFQKITWILGTIFMLGSLVLALMRSNQSRNFTINTKQQLPQQTAPQVPGNRSNQN